VVPSNDFYDYDYESIEQQLLSSSSDYISASTSTSNPFSSTTFFNLNTDSPDYVFTFNSSSSSSNRLNKTKKEKLFYPTMQQNNHNYYFAHTNIIPILVQVNCTSSEFKYTFSNRDFNYADKNRNATFIVHVYDFHTPITIQIAFSRRSRIQLLHFFVTFFGCLFSLLALAFISWKTKQRYDRFRRQRQIIIQMEQMASRPFSRLLVDVTKIIIINYKKKIKFMIKIMIHGIKLKVKLFTIRIIINHLKPKRVFYHLEEIVLKRIMKLMKII